MPTDAVDARTMTCTGLQRCEYYAFGTGPVTYDGTPVTNYWPEVERRGEAHVFGCGGIYPTGHNRDGSPLYVGEVCAFGTDDDQAAQRAADAAQTT